ncbi:hypothetical protein GIB67_009530 [Kingdonia uniflora]|uniref:Flavonoid 3'-hydroxylase n=1 Tax=Kingdonia uniflora TaxID=39325 RepID=A0A7J7NW63_9MAGN|nr:hypothetical protein GIB67_009530 [Kingdonia uniflora]
MSPVELFLSIVTSAIILNLLLRLYAVLKNPSKPFPPGPKPWPIIGNLPHMGPAPHKTLAAMVPTYGSLIHLRLGSVHVNVAASASVASQFLKTHDANFSSRPKFSGAEHGAYNYEDLVFAPYGPKWRMLRKICSVHLFSNKALDNFRHVRQEEVAVLTRALTRSGSAPVNLAQLLNVCTTNAIARVILGKRVFGNGDGSAGQESDKFKEMVLEMMVLGGAFNIADFIPSLKWFDLQGLTAKTKNLQKRFDAFLSKILDDHKINGSDGGEHTDFLSLLIKMKDEVNPEGVKLTDTNIKALLLNLFSAGTDTSSSTVEWAIAELMRNPKLLAKAQLELDTVVGKDQLVSESDIGQLPFLQAIIKETFRLHPSTPLSLPRTATESCEINGYTIPKDSTLLVNVYAIGRDPNVWAEPLEFKPERFLQGSEHADIDIKGNNFEVIPFGAGRRICAGVSLGLRMVQFTTATLIHAFDWGLPEGQMVEKLNMDEAYGLTLQRAAPLVVHPRPRLAPKLYSI